MLPLRGGFFILRRSARSNSIVESSTKSRKTRLFGLERSERPEGDEAGSEIAISLSAIAENFAQSPRGRILDVGSDFVEDLKKTPFK
jgi:hypothetical protein